MVPVLIECKWYVVDLVCNETLVWTHLSHILSVNREEDNQVIEGLWPNKDVFVASQGGCILVHQNLLQM